MPPLPEGCRPASDQQVNVNLGRLAVALKDEVDRLPVSRKGPPWNRWNYVRRVDVYDAIDRAIERAERLRPNDPSGVDQP